MFMCRVFSCVVERGCLLWPVHPLGKTLEETMRTMRHFIFGGSKITADGDCSHEIKRRLLLGRKAMTNLDSRLKSKGPSSQSYGFSSSQVWIWKLDYKGSWAPKNWCFWTVVLEKTLESPLDCKEIQPVHPKGNQSWIFIGRTDAEAEIQYFGHLMQGLTHLKRPWCLERLKAGGEGDDRGWDGWMASPTQWTWVWVSSESWLWTGKLYAAVHGVAKSRTRLNDWTELNCPAISTRDTLFLPSSLSIHSQFLKCHLFEGQFKLIFPKEPYLAGSNHCSKAMKYINSTADIRWHISNHPVRLILMWTLQHPWAVSSYLTSVSSPPAWGHFIESRPTASTLWTMKSMTIH